MKILMVFLLIFLSTTVIGDDEQAKKRLKEIDDEVNSALYCFGKSSDLCKHFKTFTAIELAEHEGISVDETSVIIAVTNETIEKKTPKITKTKDKNIVLMSILFKEPFLKFLQLNVRGVDNLILAIRDKQGKTLEAVKLNYEMLIFMDPIDIIKSVNLALVYGNERFYKLYIAPTILNH